MKSGRLKLLSAAIVLIVAVGFFAAAHKPKLHQGRTVRQWVEMLDPNVEKSKQRDEASWALAQIGADALPEIHQILSWRPGPKETLRGHAVRFRILKPHPIRAPKPRLRSCLPSRRAGGCRYW